MAFDLVGKAVKRLRLSAVNFEMQGNIVYMSQGDFGARYIKASICDDCGDMHLFQYDSASLLITDPNTGGVTTKALTNCIDTDLDCVVFAVPQEATSKVGRMKCQIRLVCGETSQPTAQLTTQPFYLIVT